MKSSLTYHIQAQDEQSLRIQELWLKNWKPLPPICTVVINRPGTILRKMELCSQALVKNRNLFRKTGRKHFAAAANRAQEMITKLESQLESILEGVS